VDRIVEMMSGARKACIVPGVVVQRADVLEALVQRLPEREPLDAPLKVTPYGEPTGSGSDPIDAGDPLYARLARFLKPGDILVGDPGSSALAATFVQMPDRATFQGQSLSASIGWGTPAALGSRWPHRIAGS
jgi:indolepyruvate decarboxylase